MLKYHKKNISRILIFFTLEKKLEYEATENNKTSHKPRNSITR